MIRRARALAVIAIVAAGALGIIASTQPWLIATLTEAGTDPLPVAGAAAVPVLAPLSLAVLALGLALSIAGTLLRFVFGVLAVAAGVLLAVLTGQVVLGRPVSAVAAAVTDATGISGEQAVRALIADISETAWPSVALAGWLLLTAAGVFTLVTARRWRGAGRRFRTDAPSDDAAVAASGPLDAIDSWDGLSRGEDPTAAGGPR